MGRHCQDRRDGEEGGERRRRPRRDGEEGGERRQRRGRRNGEKDSEQKPTEGEAAEGETAEAAPEEEEEEDNTKTFAEYQKELEAKAEAVGDKHERRQAIVDEKFANASEFKSAKVVDEDEDSVFNRAVDKKFRKKNKKGRKLMNIDEFVAKTEKKGGKKGGRNQRDNNRSDKPRRNQKVDVADHEAFPTLA